MQHFVFDQKRYQNFLKYLTFKFWGNNYTYINEYKYTYIHACMFVSIMENDQQS